MTHSYAPPPHIHTPPPFSKRPLHTWMSHGKLKNESWHTYEWGTSHIWMSHDMCGGGIRSWAADLHSWQHLTAKLRVTWLIHMCDMTHSYVWHDSFVCVTWLIHMCDMTHDSFICVTWLVYVWHVSFICVPWLIHMCAMTHVYVFTQVLLAAMVFPVSRASMGGPLVTVATLPRPWKRHPDARTHRAYWKADRRSWTPFGYKNKIPCTMAVYLPVTLLSYCITCIFWQFAAKSSKEAANIKRVEKENEGGKEGGGTHCRDIHKQDLSRFLVIRKKWELACPCRVGARGPLLPEGWCVVIDLARRRCLCWFFWDALTFRSFWIHRPIDCLFWFIDGLGLFGIIDLSTLRGDGFVYVDSLFGVVDFSVSLDSSTYRLSPLIHRLSLWIHRLCTTALSLWILFWFIDYS